jgi:chromosome segregation ATPase
MTNSQFQQELKEKVKAGIKPSDLKKLKKSKSLDDLPTSPPPNPPLKKSHSQLEIPLPPNLKQQISALQDELTTERKRVDLLREDLASEQAKNKQAAQKITQLADKILELRVEKIKEFSEYLDKKQALTQELEENLQTGTEEIERLENKLIATNKKKLELQSQLGQSQNKNAQLKLKLLSHQPSTFNY